MEAIPGSVGDGGEDRPRPQVVFQKGRNIRPRRGRVKNKKGGPPLERRETMTLIKRNGGGGKNGRIFSFRRGKESRLLPVGGDWEPI